MRASRFNSIFEELVRLGNVIARSGATKQSIAATKKKDGLLRCARNDANSRYGFATSRREASEALMNLSPKEGVGNAGCPLHPRPRVHLVVVERTRVTTSTPESPDVPARNGFTAYFVLLCPQNLPECANGRFQPTARR